MGGTSHWGREGSGYQQRGAARGEMSLTVLGSRRSLRSGGTAGRRGSVPSCYSLCYNRVGRPMQTDSLPTD